MIGTDEQMRREKLSAAQKSNIRWNLGIKAHSKIHGAGHILKEKIVDGRGRNAYEASLKLISGPIPQTSLHQPRILTDVQGIDKQQGNE